MVSVEKRVENSIVKVRLMKRYLDKDKKRLQLLLNDLEEIQKNTRPEGGYFNNGKKEN